MSQAIYLFLQAYAESWQEVIMKAVILLLSSLLFLSGNAIAGDRMNSNHGETSYFSNMLASAADLTSGRTSYKRSKAATGKYIRQIGRASCRERV